MVESKTPYFLAGRPKYRAAPHLEEALITEEFQVLVADFQCGLMLADGYKVLRE